MNKETALEMIAAKIVGAKSFLVDHWAGHDFDQRRVVPKATKKQVKAEVARLEAARADVMTWPDDPIEE